MPVYGFPLTVFSADLFVLMTLTGIPMTFLVIPTFQIVAQYIVICIGYIWHTGMVFLIKELAVWFGADPCRKYDIAYRPTSSHECNR